MENQPLKQRLQLERRNYLKKLTIHFIIRLAIGTFFVIKIFYFGLIIIRIVRMNLKVLV